MGLWIGVALLSVSWLWGLGLYYPANGWLWTLSILGGAACLCFDQRKAVPVSLPRPVALWGAVLLAAAGCLLPWPYAAAPWALAMGGAAAWLSLRFGDANARGQQPSALVAAANGLLLLGAVLSVQAAAMAAYVVQTERSHDLPAVAASGLAALLNLVGLDASASDSMVFLQTFQQTHRLAVTWDTLIDPASWCFFLGAVAALGWIAWQTVDFRAWRTWVLRLAAVGAVWLPLRALLMAGIYMQRVERTTMDMPTHAMNHYYAAWVLLALLIAPAVLAWRLVGGQSAARPSGDTPASEEATERVLPRWKGPAAVTAVAIGMAIVALGAFWAPAGPRKEGRVKVVERHSAWEPTTKPYDTTWFGHDSGYNYAMFYDLLSRYYTMSRLLEEDAINDRTLADCDVLVIKTPTSRYQPAEVAAVQRFVERGGGLLLVGDHTNLDRGSTTMNDITRKMGFIFRDDLLFCFGDATYDQPFAPPWAAHPIVQHVPPWVFAVSCSIDPGSSDGRAVVAGRGLFNMGPEYHASNFHPVPQHCPEMRGGAFVQVWAADYGQGRAVAFTDSTILSNFCLMQEGKAELGLGMIEWLNHARPLGGLRYWLWALGAAMVLGGVWLCIGAARGAWILFAGAIFLGWGAGGSLSGLLNAHTLPPPKPQRPFTQVVIDRELSDAPLSLGAFAAPGGKGFGLLEQWIPRLGYFSVRKRGDAVFTGDVLVVIQPHKAISEHYSEQLMDFVRKGGKLLVFDAADNKETTSNSLLWPFGLSFLLDAPVKGPLKTAPDLPSPQAADAWEIEGGKAVARIGNQTVAAYARCGKGEVLAVGCANLFNDTNMGEDWTADPTPEIRQRYDVLFALVRRLVEDKQPQ